MHDWRTIFSLGRPRVTYSWISLLRFSTKGLSRHLSINLCRLSTVYGNSWRRQGYAPLNFHTFQMGVLQKSACWFCNSGDSYQRRKVWLYKWPFALCFVPSRIQQTCLFSGGFFTADKINLSKREHNVMVRTQAGQYICPFKRIEYYLTLI